MAAYLYQWVHKPTNRFYIGSRTQIGCHINDEYICSSDLIENDIKANPQNWFRVILAEGKADDIIHLEKIILEHLDSINNPYSLNQTNYKGEIVFKSLYNGARTQPLKDNIKKIPSLRWD